MVKKGFFFTVDAFLAILIFTLILFSLFSYYVSSKSLTQQFYYSEDLLEVINSIELLELDPAKYSIIGEIIANQDLEDLTITPLEGISTFYNTNSLLKAEALAADLTEGLIPETGYGFGVSIEGRDVYQTGKTNVTALVSRQRIVKGGSYTY